MKTMVFDHFHIPATITTLDNGLVVASCQVRSVLAEVRRTVALGSLDDGKHPGIAHFIEHMLFEGPTRDSVHPILRPLARKAVDANASTYSEYTSYEVSGGEDVSEMLDAVLGITKNIIATPEVMELERKVILQEVAESMVQSRTYRWRKQTVFPCFPGLHHSPDGTKESVRALTLDNLKEHHGHWYGASNSFVSVVSQFPHDTIVRLAEKSWLGQAPSSKSLRPRPIIIPQCTRAVYYDTHESDEVSIYTPLPASISVRELALLGIVCNLLTSSPFGLLFGRLRTELGEIYGISASLNDDVLSGQMVVCRANTQRDKMHLVEDEYHKAVRQIVDGSYSDEVFESVINWHRKQVIYEKERAPLNGCLSDLEHIWLSGDNETVNPFQIINEANRDSLAQVAKDYLLDKPYGCLKVLEGESENE